MENADFEASCDNFSLESNFVYAYWFVVMHFFILLKQFFILLMEITKNLFFAVKVVGSVRLASIVDDQDYYYHYLLHQYL